MNERVLPEMLTMAEGFSWDQVQPGVGAYFAAEFGDQIRDNPASSLYSMGELGVAEWSGKPLSAADARAKAVGAGVKLDFGDGDTTEEAVNIQIDRALRRNDRQFTIQRYDPNVVQRLGIGLMAGVTDPINVGAAFIPFVGPARYGAMLARATTLGERTLIRAGVGAVEGLGGTALVEPVIAGATLQEGRDYTTADAMSNLAFGTVFGGGLHVGAGAIGDLIKRLPHDARELGLQTAISDLVAGKEPQAGDVVAAALTGDAKPLTARLEGMREAPDQPVTPYEPAEPLAGDEPTQLRQSGSETATASSPAERRRAEALQRFEDIAGSLPPQIVEAARAELAQIETNLGMHERLYDAALNCLLRG